MNSKERESEAAIYRNRLTFLRLLTKPTAPPAAAPATRPVLTIYRPRPATASRATKKADRP